MRIRQLGPMQFRMTIWPVANAPNDPPEQFGKSFTLTGTDFTQLFQLGEVARWGDLATWTTVSGDGRVQDRVISLVWQVREIDTLTFEHFGANTEIIFEFRCTGTPPGRP